MRNTDFRLLVEGWRNWLEECKNDNYAVLTEGFVNSFRELDKLWLECDGLSANFENSLKDKGYKLIGQGMTRRVYGKPEDDFIIKVRSGQMGSLIDANPNQGEIDINLGKSDNYIRDLVPKVYHSSADGEWIVVEKVEIIKKTDEEIIRTIFPCTTILQKILQKFFKHEVKLHDCLNLFLKLPKKEVSDDFSASNWKDTIISNVIYNVDFYARKNRYRLSDQHNDYIKKYIKIDQGIAKLFTAMQTINSTDLRVDNLGYRKPLKPYEFVIIDFDYMNFNQNRKTKFLL